MKHCIIDIETDGIHTPKNIWCVVLRDLDSGHIWDIRDKDHMKRCMLSYDDTVKYIGHNIIEYDAKVLNNLWGVTIPDDDIIDTIILSRLYSPKLEDGHSLEAWGERLGFPKDLFSDFSKFSPQLLDRCRTDVKLTESVYLNLMKKLKGSEFAIEIEHKIAFALRDAKTKGFYFDTNKAIDLREELEKERAKLDEIIHTAYPPTIVGKRKLKEVPFNPNSAKQVIDKMWEAGWKPIEKTEGHKSNLNGSMVLDERKQDRFDIYGWKLNETNLSTLPDDAPAAAKSILKRTIYETRVRKLNEWLDLVDDDGAIHGDIVGLGTWTHRMSHRHPNMANISAKKSIKYHTEELNKLATDLGGKMRSLWIARPGRVLVGTDAEGIQLRVLAEFMDDEEFTKSVVEGKKEESTDPHSLNQRRIGIGSRENAKTFIYAFILGAGDPKIAEIYNIKKSKGKELKESFIQSTPGLKSLKEERIPNECRRGYTIGFDGRKIYCNSQHHMMAAYLQGGEAIIMKVAVVLAVQEIRKQKLDAFLINIVHDEMIFESSKQDAEKVRVVCEDSIRLAGEVLKLKVPMKGEGKTGRTWLDVH